MNTGILVFLCWFVSLLIVLLAGLGLVIFTNRIVRWAEVTFIPVTRRFLKFLGYRDDQIPVAQTPGMYRFGILLLRVWGILCVAGTIFTLCYFFLLLL